MKISLFWKLMKKVAEINTRNLCCFFMVQVVEACNRQKLQQGEI
ncbi:hypothetical protein bpmyx0001_27270 [Bacillus pseudomycoides DSM 12442]|nr:hypothetical protein bpmyx0001_27270 [Bacillus pseudomycoides DSM 12442]